MAKVTKRVANSYATYLRYRAQWHDKGYGLDRELTLTEYADAQAKVVHAGEQHPARRLASEERTFTRSEARGFINRLKTADDYEDVDEEALAELRKKYKKTRDIYSQELTPEEASASEQQRRDRLAERGKEPKYTIQANARARIFNELRDAGLSYKEADKVLYGR